MEAVGLVVLEAVGWGQPWEAVGWSVWAASAQVASEKVMGWPLSVVKEVACRQRAAFSTPGRGQYRDC